MLKRLMGALLGLVLFGGTAMAQCATYPNTLTNGTTADANQVMANFNCAALLGGAAFTGNVSIGSALPGYPFQVVSGSNGSLHYASGTGFGGGASVVNLFADAASGAAYNFVNAKSSNGGSPVTAFIISSQGGVFAGDGVFPPASRAPYYAFATDGGTGMDLASASAHALTFRTNYGEIMRVTPSGVGIGTNAPPASGYLFQVAGNAYATNWINSSDERLKKNIAPLTDALGLVTRLRGVRYQWRSDQERTIGKEMKLPDGPQIGLIAQEVEAVVPEAVVAPAKGSNGTYGLKSADLIPVLVEAIKEQQTEIEQLRASLAALKAGKSGGH